MTKTRKPPTPQQLAANRANAARSTGPRTSEGKVRSAQNARQHGFTASTFAVVRLEELEEIAKLRADLVSVYQPVNSQEIFALERMAIAQQTILRAARLESGLFTACLNEAMGPYDDNGNPYLLRQDQVTTDMEVTRAQNRNFMLAEGFHQLVKKSNSWSLLLRYQAQAERNYRRALEEFERLKNLRPELPPEPTDEVLPNEPVLDPQPEPNQTTSTPVPTHLNPPISPSSPSARCKRVNGPAPRGLRASAHPRISRLHPPRIAPLAPLKTLC